MFALSDVVWQAIIAGVVTVILSYIALKQTLLLQKIKQTGDAVHTLTNNAMSVQLRLNAELSVWKASQTHLQVDKAAAEIAIKLLQEHDKQQKKIEDAKK